jgi:hypothetical protein
MVGWIYSKEDKKEWERREGEREPDKGKKSEKKKKRYEEDASTIKAPSETSCLHYKL